MSTWTVACAHRRYICTFVSESTKGKEPKRAKLTGSVETVECAPTTTRIGSIRDGTYT